MNTTNANIVFKGTKDGITVILDDKTDFEDLRFALAKKISDSKNFFDGSITAVSFKGRALTADEEGELTALIEAAGATLKVVSNEHPKSRKEDTNLFSEMVHHRQVSAFQNNTIYHRGALRGGQSISHKGSVVIIGDVNPGGEIVAEGNIIIMGSLKGVAHAGSKGNRDCFVAALNLVPSQLRIADIITSIAEEFANNKFPRPVPSYAYIHAGQIYISPLV